MNDSLFPEGQEELEIIEFSLNESFYGVRIADVREIIKADMLIVVVPDANLSVEGAINLRGTIIPIINLGKLFHLDLTYDKRSSRIIISEIDQVSVGFWVSSVSKIHRISKQQVEPPAELLQTKERYAIAVVKLAERIIFMLDFKKIASQIIL